MGVTVTADTVVMGATDMVMEAIITHTPMVRITDTLPTAMVMGIVGMATHITVTDIVMGITGSIARDLRKQSRNNVI